MSEDKAVQIVRQQAQRLGGGWRMEHGVMPVVVLTTVEAEAVIQHLDRKPLAITYEDPKRGTVVLHPDNVTYLYTEDGA